MYPKSSVRAALSSAWRACSASWVAGTRQQIHSVGSATSSVSRSRHLVRTSNRSRCRGLRGIGPRQTLELVPGPGLTVVAGRNGSGKSSFAEGTWTRARLLHLLVPGVAHAIHLWWLPPNWHFGGWYVNLQESIRRTPVGFDYMDHMLDIVIEPDLSWRWKDADELEAAINERLVTRSWANGVRREGERVIRRLDAGLAPFCDGWEHWQPEPAWSMPELPDGWQDVRE
jgi:hypothetical protein